LSTARRAVDNSAKLHDHGVFKHVLRKDKS